MRKFNEIEKYFEKLLEKGYLAFDTPADLVWCIYDGNHKIVKFEGVDYAKLLDELEAWAN